jgi:thioredoxin-related protein
VVQVVAAGALVVVALVVAAVLRRRRRPDVPTQPTYLVPQLVDRRDFVAPGESPQDEPEWMVIVFSSATCHTCADVVRKANVLASPHVAVRNVEYGTDRALHTKYDIQAVPMVVFVDGAGVVRRGFTGPVTATDLWAALAEARQPGSSPEPHLGDTAPQS